MNRIQVIDSHTEGEPTRVVLEGQLPLRGSTMVERRADFATRFDDLRRGLVLEPRGADPVVGAVLTEPVNLESIAGVVYFNNAGVLGMCGHGTMGVAETLAHLGRIGHGEYQLDTPVGPILFQRDSEGMVSIQNVESYRFAKNVPLFLEGLDPIVGDIAWGGNWFYIVHYEGMIEPALIPELIELTTEMLEELEVQGHTGAGGARIDHIELSKASIKSGVDARNFVLCPGLAFDRSPCGTGTSAKVACLAEDGVLTPGQIWTQESVTGGIFRATVEKGEQGWIPTIRGRAFVTAVATLFFQESDPYRTGLQVR